MSVGVVALRRGPRARLYAPLAVSSRSPLYAFLDPRGALWRHVSRSQGDLQWGLIASVCDPLERPGRFRDVPADVLRRHEALFRPLYACWCRSSNLSVPAPPAGCRRSRRRRSVTRRCIRVDRVDDSAPSQSVRCGCGDGCSTRSGILRWASCLFAGAGRRGVERGGAVARCGLPACRWTPRCGACGWDVLPDACGVRASDWCCSTPCDVVLLDLVVARAGCGDGCSTRSGSWDGRVVLRVRVGLAACRWRRADGSCCSMPTASGGRGVVVTTVVRRRRDDRLADDDGRVSGAGVGMPLYALLDCADRAVGGPESSESLSPLAPWPVAALDADAVVVCCSTLGRCARLRSRVVGRVRVRGPDIADDSLRRELLHAVRFPREWKPAG